MRNISDTMTRLAAGKLRGVPSPVFTDQLDEVTAFGSNPGNLRARTYLPANLPRHAPLVVVLHGCTQTAAGYDQGAGWSRLADRAGFALLFPEQQRANNANLCFNWFVPEDVRRDGGEALSIRQMVAQMIVDHDLDPARVFVTGLSAGGAMASVMLSTYPEVFAGGAIIAGLAFGGAASVPQAFDRMRGAGWPGANTTGGYVRSASAHPGPWPTLSVWQGDADRTVDVTNMAAIIDQWRAVQGLPEAPSAMEVVDGHQRRVWRDADGRDRIEAYTIAGMGHGTPLDPAAGDGGGEAGPFMLDVGIASTQRIAAFWGIAAPVAAANTSRKPPPFSDAAGAPTIPRAQSVASGVTKTIEAALRASGLLR